MVFCWCYNVYRCVVTVICFSVYCIIYSVWFSFVYYTLRMGARSHWQLRSFTDSIIRTTSLSVNIHMSNSWYTRYHIHCKYSLFVFQPSISNEIFQLSTNSFEVIWFSRVSSANWNCFVLFSMHDNQIEQNMISNASIAIFQQNKKET